MARVTALVLFAWGAVGCQFPDYSTRLASFRGAGGTGGSDAGTAGSGATTGGKKGDGEAGSGNPTGGRGGDAADGGVGGRPGPAEGGSGGSSGSGGSGGSAALQPLGPEGDWQLTFHDEFDGEDLDTSAWKTLMVDKSGESRTWGGRQELIADENTRVEDGSCILTAENRASGGQPFTSGGINTGNIFEQEQGYFEARVSLPSGTGLWSMVTLRSLEGWPPSVNVAEQFGDAVGNPACSYWWQSGSEFLHEEHRTKVTGTEDFHVYGVEWDASYIASFVDGKLAQRFDDAAGRVSGPLFVALNLSIPVEGAGVVPDDTTPWPAEMRIDWVRVYVKAE